MKILLTGGAGYIGSHTAVELLQAGHEVVIADNFSASHPGVLERIARLTGKEPVLYRINVADTLRLQQLFDREHLDGVIHFAGHKAVAESARHPLSYYRNNLDTVMTLLECMHRAQVRHLIVSSSAAVYGTQQNTPLTEECCGGACTSPYGWSKRMIEQIVRDDCAARPEFSVVLLRYFNPAGAHPTGLLGEAAGEEPGTIMQELVLTAAGKRPELLIYGDDLTTPDGTGVRDFVHVVDLARGHLAALRYSRNHTGVQVINLGTGRSCSVRELVDTFCRVNGVAIPCRYVPQREGDIHASYADVSRARTLLGWQAERTLEDMCRDAWNWQRNNPRGYEDDRYE